MMLFAILALLFVGGSDAWRLKPTAEAPASRLTIVNLAGENLPMEETQLRLLIEQIFNKTQATTTTQRQGTRIGTFLNRLINKNFSMSREFGEGSTEEQDLFVLLPVPPQDLQDVVEEQSQSEKAQPMPGSFEAEQDTDLIGHQNKVYALYPEKVSPQVALYRQQQQQQQQQQLQLEGNNMMHKAVPLPELYPITSYYRKFQEMVHRSPHPLQVPYFYNQGPEAYRR